MSKIDDLKFVKACRFSKNNGFITNKDKIHLSQKFIVSLPIFIVNDATTARIDTFFMSAIRENFKMLLDRALELEELDYQELINEVKKEITNVINEL